MTGKRRGKQTQAFSGKSGPTGGATPEGHPQVSEQGGAPDDASRDADAQTETDEQALRRHFEECYSWEALVERNGVEGAEIIADCLDFDFDFED